MGYSFMKAFNKLKKDNCHQIQHQTLFILQYSLKSINETACKGVIQLLFILVLVLLQGVPEYMTQF